MASGSDQAINPPSKGSLDVELDIKIICDHCNVSFDSEDDWDLHIRSGHSADDQVLISSLLALASDPGPSNYQPPPSNSAFAREETNQPNEHEPSVESVPKIKKIPVTTLKDYKCSIKGCSYYFSSVESLQVHVSCHQVDSNSFQCQIENCQTSFQKWKKCSLHLWRQHNLDLDLYSCPMCPELKYANAYQLEIHNQTHSEERSFVCSVCQRSFKQLAQLRNHAVIHLDKSKSAVPSWFAKKQCHVCDKFFADSKCLKKHVQAVHSKLVRMIYFLLHSLNVHVCNHLISIFRNPIFVMFAITNVPENRC